MTAPSSPCVCVCVCSNFCWQYLNINEEKIIPIKISWNTEWSKNWNIHIFKNWEHLLVHIFNWFQTRVILSCYTVAVVIVNRCRWLEFRSLWAVGCRVGAVVHGGHIWRLLWMLGSEVLSARRCRCDKKLQTWLYSYHSLGEETLWEHKNTPNLQKETTG